MGHNLFFHVLRSFPTGGVTRSAQTTSRTSAQQIDSFNAALHVNINIIMRISQHTRDAVICRHRPSDSRPPYWTRLPFEIDGIRNTSFTNHDAFMSSTCGSIARGSIHTVPACLTRGFRERTRFLAISGKGIMITCRDQMQSNDIVASKATRWDYRRPSSSISILLSSRARC